MDIAIIAATSTDKMSNGTATTSITVTTWKAQMGDARNDVVIPVNLRGNMSDLCAVLQVSVLCDSLFLYQYMIERVMFIYIQYKTLHFEQ